MEETTLEKSNTETKPRKVVQPATMAPDIREQVLALASERDWSASQAAGFLIKLGLERLREGADKDMAVRV